MEDAAKKYYYIYNGDVAGPVDLRELCELYRTAKIHRDTDIHSGGQAVQWKKLSELIDLHAEIKKALGSFHLPGKGAEGYFVGLPGEKPQGPFTFDEIRTRIQAHELTQKHFVFDEIASDWVPLFTHSDFDRRRLLRASEQLPHPSSMKAIPIPKAVQAKRRVWRVAFGIVALMASALWAWRSPQMGCMIGNGKACTVMGRQAIERKDFSAAFNIFQQSCKKGNAEHCADTALVLREMGRGVKEQGEYLKKSCAGGYGPACFELSQALRKTDPDESALLLEKACDLREGHSCVVLGEQSLKEQQPTKAQDFFEKGCQGGFSPSCIRLGALLKDLKEPVASMKAFENGCALQSGPACLGFAQSLYEQGATNLARTAFQKACEMNVALGCTGAANIAFQKSETQSGERLAQKACELGDRVGCGLIGAFYAQAGQLDRAKPFLVKACNQKSALSCFTLARALKGTHFGPQAASYFKKACVIDPAYCRRPSSR